jgi:hypothetical protein
VIQISLPSDNPSKIIKIYIIYNDYNLMVFDGLSIDNEITCNLNHYQYIRKRTYL